MRAKCPTNWLNEPNNNRWKIKIRSSSLCYFLRRIPVTASLLNPKVILTALFSGNFNLCISMFFLSNERPSSTPIRTTEKIILLCTPIWICRFLNSRWEDKGFWAEWQHALPESILILILSWRSLLSSHSSKVLARAMRLILCGQDLAISEEGVWAELIHCSQQQPRQKFRSYQEWDFISVYIPWINSVPKRTDNNGSSLFIEKHPHYNWK